MDVIGSTTGACYCTADLLTDPGGEGAVYRVVGRPRLLVKIFKDPLSDRDAEKFAVLAAWPNKPAFAALPLENVLDAATNTVVGFVQPLFARTAPFSRLLDSVGRTTLGLSDHLSFRVKLIRLLSESVARVHASELVIGDFSEGNFLLGLSRFGWPTTVFSIDCNSFHIAVRTRNGNDIYPSGVATEEYTAPEVQPTDWSSSPRTVFSDCFGFGVLAWKILFDGSHPFSVVTPRSVDVPPLGERIEKRLFPWFPGTPLPQDWKAPPLQPPLSILPPNIRELFFRTFSVSDPRDRPTSTDWCQAFREWEAELTPALPLRLLAMCGGFPSANFSEWFAKNRRVAGLALAGLVLAAVGVLIPADSRPASPISDPTSEAIHGLAAPIPDLSQPPKRPRCVDPDLFPELVSKPATPPRSAP